MDNNMNPFAPQPSKRPEQPSDNGAGLPPAMDNNQSQNPQATTPLNDPNQPKLNDTGVELASPILGPTHFDGMHNPEFSNSQSQPAAIGSAIPNQPQTTDAQKAKTYMILSILFGALAFIGIIVGIWSLVNNINTSTRLANAEATLGTAGAIIQKVEDETGTTINSPDDVPEYTPVTGYIYISEWGIKFKIPEDLENVSYIVDQKYRPQICFAAHKSGMRYFPGFADIDKNLTGLGCVTRVATNEGDFDKDTGISFGQKIYTYGDYSYFYSAPQAHFSQDATEQGLEDTAVQIIKNMIANNISHYE